MPAEQYVGRAYEIAERTYPKIKSILPESAFVSAITHADSPIDFVSQVNELSKDLGNKLKLDLPDKINKRCVLQGSVCFALLDTAWAAWPEVKEFYSQQTKQFDINFFGGRHTFKHSYNPNVAQYRGMLRENSRIHMANAVKIWPEIERYRDLAYGHARIAACNFTLHVLDDCKEIGRAYAALQETEKALRALNKSRGSLGRDHAQVYGVADDITEHFFERHTRIFGEEIRNLPYTREFCRAKIAKENN